MRWVVAVIVLLSARELAACVDGHVWDPNEVVENTPVYSANGRFCAIVRWNDGIPDFGNRLAGELFNPDAEPEAEPAPRSVVVPVGWYESKRLLTEIPVSVDVINDVLVSDSGRYLVAVNRGWPDVDAPLLTIYKSNGSRVATVNIGDVATRYDITQLHGVADVEFALRPVSDTREVIVISFRVSPTEIAERRVDLTDGTLLDEKRPLFHPPQATVMPSSEGPRRDFDPESAACVDADAVMLASAEFLGRTLDAPLPPYPDLALRARVSGYVRVEAVVSEKGQVLCTRHSRLPFGIDAAADEAVRRWFFKPLSVNGKRVRFRGEMIFLFK